MLFKNCWPIIGPQSIFSLLSFGIVCVCDHQSFATKDLTKSFRQGDSQTPNRLRILETIRQSVPFFIFIISVIQLGNTKRVSNLGKEAL